MSTPPSLFNQCPKCGHSPLPKDQSLPAACPACGLVLAKFGVAPPPRVREDEAAEEDRPVARLTSLVTHVPATVDPAALWMRFALLAVFAAWGVRLIFLDHRIGEMGSSFLHGPLLVFHEAGHVLFMLFNRK